MPVARAQEEISSAEFAEWIAMNTIEPFTVNRTESMLSIIACILANVHRKKGAPEYRPEDFIPSYGPKRRQSADEIMAKLKTLFPNGNN